MIIQFSSKFKNPYLQKIPKKIIKTVENPLNLNVEIENYLLKKPREGRAFLPGNSTNIKIFKDLSFMPIEKMIVDKQKPLERDEEFIENSITTELFSIYTKPLCNEDIGVSMERKTKSIIEPMRYFGLKIKKMKPNSDRKGKKKNTNTKN